VTTALSSILFRGTRRVRLFFTGALGSGAFTTPSLYAFASNDGSGGPINVIAVFAVINTPSAVELAIDEDLAPGTLYTATCTAVPCVVGPSFTGSLDAQVGQPLESPINVEPSTTDVDLLLFKRDLVHDGIDFVEDATGDLLTQSGRESYRGALGRRMSSDGLPWDDTYGAKPDQYVDAPETQSVPFAGNLMAQARADDRTKQAAVTVVQSPDNPGDWAFELELTPIDDLDPLTLTILPPTQ
jgi:hypothetical protein